MNTSLSPFHRLASLIPAIFLFGASSAQANFIDDKLEQMELQSPIDIRPDNTTYVPQLPRLEFDFSSDTALAVINTGSPDHEKSVMATPASGAGTLTTSGEKWDLAQFHFHTPSEHRLNSEQTPLEMHLVFTDADEDVLVVGRWVNYGAANAALNPIFSNLPQTVNDPFVLNSFDLNSLLPASNMQSFRYSGSFTTEPYAEGVSWINLADPLYMSSGQVQAFQKLFPEGDSRSVQPLNGRVVLTDVPEFATAVPEPQTYAMLLAGLGLIVLVTRQRSANLRPAGSAA